MWRKTTTYRVSDVIRITSLVFTTLPAYIQDLRNSAMQGNGSIML